MGAGSAREHWEDNAENWIGFTATDPHYEFLNKPAFFELVPAPGSVTLELGCGEGRMARELIARGHRVVGVDGSPTLATAAANSTPPVPVAVADLTRLPVASRSVDLVVCFMVLMDIEDLDGAFAEIARVLAPGGIVCAAILHPIISSGLFIDGDPNHTFYMGEYAREMRHVFETDGRAGGRFTFRVEHRPLERYSRALEAAGLALTLVREPTPDDATVEAHPYLANFQRVPEFLHLRAERRAV